MDDLVQLLRITSAVEIAEKWNVSVDRLNELIQKHALPLYRIREKRVRPEDCKTVYFCSMHMGGFWREAEFLEYFSYGDDPGELVLEGEYLNADDIEAYETKYPEILWAVSLEADHSAGDNHFEIGWKKWTP